MTAVEGGDSSGSRRWKLRWQPHAAHFSELGFAGSVEGEGMNSPHPSTAWPPMVAAWFFRHSLYVTTAAGVGLRWRLSTPFTSGLMRWIRVGASDSASGVLILALVDILFSMGVSKSSIAVLMEQGFFFLKR